MTNQIQTIEQRVHIILSWLANAAYVNDLELMHHRVLARTVLDQMAAQPDTPPHPIGPPLNYDFCVGILAEEIEAAVETGYSKPTYDLARKIMGRMGWHKPVTTPAWMHEGTRRQARHLVAALSAAHALPRMGKGSEVSTIFSSGELELVISLSDDLSYIITVYAWGNRDFGWDLTEELQDAL